MSRSGASVSWYPFNYPLTINQAGGNTSTFYYAPDRSRYRQVSLNGGTSEDRTYVGGGLFEKLSSSVEGVVYRHMIRAGDKTVAVRVVSATRNDTYYTHDDHLGSTSAITDQTGAVQIQESFDAWGKRRGSAWSGAPSAADLAAITKTTHRGFTSQEELDNLSLIDLNGRVYDPTVARFLSADPLVQAPYASQSLNRYSYTFDNPLNATDPTGFDAECENSPDCAEAKKADAPVRNSGATPSATQADAQQNSAQQVSGATVPAAAMATAVQQTSTLEQVVVHAARVTGEALAEASATASAAGAAVGMGTIVVIGMMPSNGLSGHDLRDEPLARKAMMSGSSENPDKTNTNLSGTTEAGTVGPGQQPNDDDGDKGKNSGGKATTIGNKIQKQLSNRGWSPSDVGDAVDNPMRTVSTRDTRFKPDGTRMDDPATAYYSRDGGYVVRNDRTGDVVQVSDRSDPNWKAPWD